MAQSFEHAWAFRVCGSDNPIHPSLPTSEPVHIDGNLTSFPQLSQVIVTTVSSILLTPLIKSVIILGGRPEPAPVNIQGRPVRDDLQLDSLYTDSKLVHCLLLIFQLFCKSFKYL